MTPRTVIFEPDARLDMLGLYGWISEGSSPSVARKYVQRVGEFIRKLDLASERGTLRSDIRPEARTVGFEGRLTIAFRVTPDEVRILGVFRAGQDWATILADR